MTEVVAGGGGGGGPCWDRGDPRDLDQMMLLGQEAFLATDLRRETKAGVGGCNELARSVNSWSRGRNPVESLNCLHDDKTHRQPPKHTAQFHQRRQRSW